MALSLLHCDNLLRFPLLKEVSFHSLLCAPAAWTFSRFSATIISIIFEHIYGAFTQSQRATITNVSHVRHRHHKVKKLKIQFAKLHKHINYNLPVAMQGGYGKRRSWYDSFWYRMDRAVVWEQYISDLQLLRIFLKRLVCNLFCAVLRIFWWNSKIIIVFLIKNNSYFLLSPLKIVYSRYLAQ